MFEREPELVDPAPQWRSIIGSREALVEIATGWPLDERTNEEVSRHLAICRDLFVHSYFVYEFGLVAVIWSTLAVEAALRDQLGDAATQYDGLSKLIGKAQGRSWVTAAQGVQLRAATEFRNRIVHARPTGC